MTMYWSQYSIQYLVLQESKSRAFPGEDRTRLFHDASRPRGEYVYPHTDRLMRWRVSSHSDDQGASYDEGGLDTITGRLLHPFSCESIFMPLPTIWEGSSRWVLLINGSPAFLVLSH